jgi:hypothetical protein
LEEEEAFVADYEETYSMAGYEQPEQELSDEEDTRSVINEASKPQNVSIRQDVIAKLRTLAGKPAAVDQPPPCPDAMENMFQASKALVSKPKQSGFAFSINQRSTLDGIVNPGKRVIAKALSVSERKLLMRMISNTCELLQSIKQSKICWLHGRKGNPLLSRERSGVFWGR